MGANLELKPKSGHFDFKSIGTYLDSCKGAICDCDTNLEWMFVGDPNRPKKEKMPDQHGFPFVQCRPESGCVLVSIEWTDDKYGNLKKFILWILKNYDCCGRDSDGYEYDGSSACLDWVENWLPKNDKLDNLKN